MMRRNNNYNEPPRMQRRNNALNEMEMELEVLRRKREFIQEQRQVLEEEQQLKRLQVETQQWNPSTNNMNRYDNFGNSFSQFKPQQFGQGFTATGSTDRNRKRGAPEPAPAWGNKRRLNESGFQDNFRPAPRNIQGTGPRNFQGTGSKNFQGAGPRNFQSGPRQASSGPGPRGMQGPRNIARPKKKPAGSFKEGPTVLKPGEPIPVYVKGRMEMALGAILKEMKDVYKGAPHNVDFSVVSQTKWLKTQIRERILKVLEGKIVGSSWEIIQAYKKDYSIADKEMIDKMLLEPDLKPAPREGQSIEKSLTRKEVFGEPTKEETWRYYSTNLKVTLERKLNEMFFKLQQVYEEDINTAVDEAVIYQPEEKTADVAMTEDGNKTEDASAENGENKTETEENKPENGEDVSEKTENNPENGENKPEEGENKPENGEKKPENGENKPEKGENKPENGENRPENSLNPLDVDINEESSHLYYFANDTVKKLDNKEKFFKESLGLRIKSILPSILPLYKQQIISMLFSDKQFKTLLTTEKYHFLKVFGKPSLPKKHLINAFLDGFKPVYVRKHKIINNLLMVGVKDLDSYRNILAKNNCVLDGCRLLMRGFPDDMKKIQCLNLAPEATEAKTQEAEEEKPKEEKPEEVACDFTEDVQVTPEVAT